MDLDPDPTDILFHFSALKSKQARCIVYLYSSLHPSAY